MSKFDRNWRWPLYCYVRSILWGIIWSFILGIPIYILQEAIVLLGNRPRIAVLLDFRFSLGFSLVSIFAIVCGTKLSLGKMFFKPYRKFALQPKIQAISWWLAFKTELALFASKVCVCFVTFSLLCTSLAMVTPDENLDFKNLDAFHGWGRLVCTNWMTVGMTFLYGILGLAGSIWVSFIIKRGVLRKYATIVEDIRTEIQH
jgi:hypothetical protein